MQVVAFLSQNRQFYQKTEILSLERVIKICYCAFLFGKFIYKILNQQAVNAYLKKHKVVMSAQYTLESTIEKGRHFRNRKVLVLVLVHLGCCDKTPQTR